MQGTWLTHKIGRTEPRLLLRTLRAQVLFFTALLAMVALLGGCNFPEFNEASQVTKTRILAISAIPGELEVAGQVELEVVVAVPPGGAEIQTWTWSVCAATTGPQAGYDCIAPAQLPLNPERASAETLTIRYSDIEGWVGGADALCGQLDAFPLPRFIEAPDCRRGFPLTVRLSLQDANGDTHEAKRSLLVLKAGEEARPHPQVQGILWASDGGDGGDESPGDEEALAFPLEETIKLRVQLDELPLRRPADHTGAEEDDDAPTDWLMDWYSSTGELEHARTYYRPGATAVDEFLGNELTLDRAEDEATLWVVLRNGQGAVSWASRHFQVVK